MLWLVVLALVAAAIFYSAWAALKRSCWIITGGTRNAPNPFSPAFLPTPGRLVTDQEERDKVIKQSFAPDKVPQSLDAIVVGSGIGGLTTAALLAKTGKRVLVLEQHDQAGGCCHTFIDKGFEFDTGIHYLGEMAEGTLSRVLVDQLSEGKIEWARLEEVYDTVMLGVGEEGRERREFPVPSGKGAWEKVLIEHFPSEEKGIRKYFELVTKVIKSPGKALGLPKLAPKWMMRLLFATGLLPRMFPVLTYFRTSLAEVLDSLFTDQELKTVLAYAFLNYGTAPKDASFIVHAMMTRHLTNGGYYPKGGASEIAFHIIPTIEKAGGKVLVRAPVRELLLNEDKEAVIGVQVKKGHNVYDILAPLVISDAGLQNTARNLLPKEVSEACGLGPLAERVRAGLHLMTVFIGLDGTKEELGLKASNVFAFRHKDIHSLLEKYVSLPAEEASRSPVPLIFLSFPSTKDPTINDRFPGKSTCEIITATPHRWFQAWQSERVMHRGEDYQGLKMAIAHQAWNQVLEIFPQLEGRAEYFDVGTPLSNQYYLGSYGGEVYGIDHDVGRFAPDVMVELRPQTGLAGLFLTGQDVMACGFSGGMYGGLMCASAILQQNILDDLLQVKKELQKKWKGE